MLSGVLVVDPRSGVVSLTPEARQLLGLPAEHPLKTSLEKLPDAVSSLAQEALSSGKPGIARQIEIPGQPGSGFAHINAIPINSPNGDSMVVLTVHGLNPASPFLRQIRQLDRLANTGTLAAGLAHEIKNALVAGRTFLDLLLEKNTDEELVQIVRRENGRIDSIVSRMLRFASVTTPALSTLHVHEVLDHALRLVQPQVSDKSILLDRIFQAKPDTVKGDEYELQQAFVNLVLNALEATSKDGRLTVTTQNASEAATGARQLQIVIKDSGTGIQPEHLSHLFEPFFTTKASGTGLGLAITRRIIQEHGGSISVESHPGDGTMFTVLLPEVEESRIAQQSGFATTMRGRRPK